MAAAVAVLSLSSGSSKRLVQGSAATYASTGHLVFNRGGFLMTVPFDPTPPTVTGDPVEVLPVSGGRFGLSDHQVSASGHLAYMDAAKARRMLISTLVTVDRKGNATPFHEEPQTGWLQPQLSPSGSRLAHLHETSVENAFRDTLENHELASVRSVPVFRMRWSGRHLAGLEPRRRLDRFRFEPAGAPTPFARARTAAATLSS
jgi:hypothetical protein